MNAPSGKRVTLREVAAASGVSQMTVSRVIREHGAVNACTRKRVQAAIQQTGYRPDPMMSALAAYRQAGHQRNAGSSMVFLDCDGTDYSRAVYEGVQREAAQFGYRAEFMVMPKGVTGQKQLCRVLYHRGVRGLLLGPSEREVDLRSWDWSEFAAVSLGALVHAPGMDAVAMDYFQGALEACQQLREQGCQRIAFVVKESFQARTGNRWLGGYQAGLRNTMALINTMNWQNPTEVKAWLKNKKSDALVTIHTELLHIWPGLSGNVRLLNNYGLHPTKALHGVPRLSLDCGHIGEEGVRLLHHQLMRQHYGLPDEPKLVSLRGRWVCP